MVDWLVGCSENQQYARRLIVSLRLGSDGDLDLDAGLDIDNDLLDDLGRGVQAIC